MVTGDNAVFVDTNILVYANLALSPFHVQAVERLQVFNDQGIDLWLSRQVLREYLSAMTSGRSNRANSDRLSCSGHSLLY
ncbi:hypothetical protein K9N68_22920 [Kovacikia minuta CCNUW1]|uniref:type II toxin-antitoxin system VapC family toxin n=1 Tax=Kovacikia minuta TaxID=2931930 RepID=UPI001CCD5A48|nr:hypothetical protein [Kovacikia minuta]UBF24523.1 hypothetical protein K9N68_22920 [Kovacikia minuta CCNUW1]